MRAAKTITVSFLGVLLMVIFFPMGADSQALKVSVADIYANPNRYDGTMVQVEGRALFVKSKFCEKGDYTTIDLADHSGKSLTVFSYGHFPISTGDKVKVIGIYKKVFHVPPNYTFYNEIDASTGCIEKLK